MARRRSSVGGLETQQNDNPENAFSKIMGITSDTAIRQCKLLLESMREQCLFQKNIIHNTRNVSIPKSAAIERNKSQNYQNYERLLTYAKKKRDISEFQQKTLGKISLQVKKNRVKTLRDFVEEKKTKMLTEESKYQFNDMVIENILRDDKAREKLFDQSILLQRLHFIRKQEQAAEQEKSTIPKKFKGLNPKHLRMPERNLDEQAFYRRKYVHNQRTFQYFKNAIKTENSMLKTKQKQNSLVISKLMQHFSEQVMKNQGKEDTTNSKCIHRLFLKYANTDSEDIHKMYKFISRSNILKFFKDFDISYEQNDKIKKILAEFQINQFCFLEIIHLLSPKDGSPFYSDIQSFLKEKVLTRPQIYLPLQWQLFETHRSFISKHLKVRRFRQKLSIIYQTFIDAKRTSSRNFYNFDEMVEVMWILKIYPFMISKKRLRFFYLYSQCEETGVNISDISDIYIYIALSREGQAEENIKEIVRIICNFSKEGKK